MIYVIDANNDEILNSFNVFEDAVSYINKSGFFEVSYDEEHTDVDSVIYVDTGEEH